jgi:hypothetical protein
VKFMLPREDVNDDGADQRKIQGQKADPDANAGSDYDAMPVQDGGEEVPPADDPSVVPARLGLKAAG